MKGCSLLCCVFQNEARHFCSSSMNARYPSCNAAVCFWTLSVRWIWIRLSQTWFWRWRSCCAVNRSLTAGPSSGWRKLQSSCRDIPPSSIWGSVCASHQPALKTPAVLWVHSSLSLLQEKLLSARGQNDSNPLYELLQSELQRRPDDAYINIKLVRLYSADGRHEEALKHCLAVEKNGRLRDRLEWCELLVSTLQVSDRPKLSVSSYVRQGFLHHQIMKNHLTDSYMGCFLG